MADFNAETGAVTVVIQAVGKTTFEMMQAMFSMGRSVVLLLRRISERRYELDG